MTHATDLEVLVDLIDEDLDGSDGVLLRGPEATDGRPDSDRRRAVVERLRDDPDARLTLFLFALEARRDSAGSAEALGRELEAFATRMADRFDVDILETVAENRDRLPELPRGLLPEEGEGDSGRPVA